MTKLNQRWTKWLIVALACGLGGSIIAGVLAHSTKHMVVVPVETTKFAPLDPAHPDGAQFAVLWGDPANGPSAMLVKFKKGVSPFHSHSSDYHLSLLQGTMKHWEEGQREEDAKPLEPGSYWFQPANVPHADACLSDECLTFVYWLDRRDYKPSGTTKK
jgi:quercetin dioxygenase-like cupin family protein